MKQYFFYAAAALAMAACNGGSTDGHENHAEARTDGFSDKAATAEDSLYNLVIAGHDEAMAKMGKIRGFRATAESRLDSLKKAAGKDKESLVAAYKQVQAQLDTAYQGMNAWMEGFNPDSAKEDAAKRKEYLQSELDKVNKVKEAIFSSLSRADSTFK